MLIPLRRKITCDSPECGNMVLRPGLCPRCRASLHYWATHRQNVAGRRNKLNFWLKRLEFFKEQGSLDEIVRRKRARSHG